LSTSGCLACKHGLFAGQHNGGTRAAAICTPVGTVKLNGLDPETYLRHVLERIADHPINRINGPLPLHVAERLQCQPRVAA
jgi:transposase